jgi:hypothetical protein
MHVSERSTARVRSTAARSVDPSSLTKKQKEQAIARALAEIESKLIQEGALRPRVAVSADEQQRRVEQEKLAREEGTKEPPWFYFFDPYASLLATGDPAFRAHNGTLLDFRKGAQPLARELLFLAIEAAKEAFSELDLTTQDISREQWKKSLENAKHFVAEAREDFPFESVQLVDPLGKQLTQPVQGDLDAFNVMWMVHQAIEKSKAAESVHELSELLLFLRTVWCFVALHEIDTAVLALLYDDAGDGAISGIRATQAIANAKSLLFTSQLPFKQMMAASGARAKLERDPKQLAKRLVKELWTEWWNDRRHRYRTKTQFAKDMLEKFPELANQAVIVRWCTGWEKEK